LAVYIFPDDPKQAEHRFGGALVKNLIVFFTAVNAKIDCCFCILADNTKANKDG